LHTHQKDWQCHTKYQFSQPPCPTLLFCNILTIINMLNARVGLTACHTVHLMYKISVNKRHNCLLMYPPLSIHTSHQEPISTIYKSLFTTWASKLNFLLSTQLLMHKVISKLHAYL
jgi:hypothetical protein